MTGSRRRIRKSARASFLLHTFTACFRSVVHSFLLVEFTQADLNAASEIIAHRCDKTDVVRGLLETTVYGSRMDSQFDLRVLKTFTENSFPPQKKDLEKLDKVILSVIPKTSLRNNLSIPIFESLDRDKLVCEAVVQHPDNIKPIIMSFYYQPSINKHLF